MCIIKFKLLPVPVRLHSDSGLFNFVFISQCFVIFKNAVHSLEPVELLGVSSGCKLCATLLDIAKYYRTGRFCCGYFFFKLLAYAQYRKTTLNENENCKKEQKTGASFINFACLDITVL